MRCLGPMALAGVVDHFDEAHEFIVAAIVVIVVSSAWGSYVQWQEESKLEQSKQAAQGDTKVQDAEAINSRFSPRHGGATWDGVKITGPKDQAFTQSTKFSK
ncbi:MAG: hypothetical protein K2X81_12925 [Candidatus Obscuribacterales bacterium]|nr:hypothetical protein [Candidatus Obscuribacterales bacterium]